MKEIKNFFHLFCYFSQLFCPPDIDTFPQSSSGLSDASNQKDFTGVSKYYFVFSDSCLAAARLVLALKPDRPSSSQDVSGFSAPVSAAGRPLSNAVRHAHTNQHLHTRTRFKRTLTQTDRQTGRQMDRRTWL